MATITVTRTPGGGALGLVVEVDGEKIGRVRPKKSIAHDVAPGRHQVKVKRGWASVSTDVDVGEGNDAEVVCGEASGFDEYGRINPTHTLRALANNGGLTIGVSEPER